jgi:hypothetical protein
MRVLVLACFVLGLAGHAHAQTPPPVPTPPRVDAAAGEPIVVVNPRKERPMLMEALIRKDKRLALELRKLARDTR